MAYRTASGYHLYNKQLLKSALDAILHSGTLKGFNKIKDNYDIINYHFPVSFMDMHILMAHPKGKTVVYHSDIIRNKSG